MKMSLISFGIVFFKFAGPNDFVSFYRKGIKIASGKGLAGFLRPGTSVSVVPLGVKTIVFQVLGRSKDQQQIAVSGEIVMENVPEMGERFNFSVFPGNGQFRNDPTAQIEDLVRIAVRKPIRDMLSGMTMIEISSSDGAVSLEKMLGDHIGDTTSELVKQLATNEIAVQSCSVKMVNPDDRDLDQAVGVEEREKMLKIKDDAVADRRQGAAEKDREIRTYEEETELELAKENAKRIEQEGINQLAKASAESKAVAKQLEPFSDMEAGMILAYAIVKASENGINHVSIDPALIAAMRNSAE